MADLNLEPAEVFDNVSNAYFAFWTKHITPEKGEPLHEALAKELAKHHTPSTLVEAVYNQYLTKIGSGISPGSERHVKSYIARQLGNIWYYFRDRYHDALGWPKFDGDFASLPEVDRGGVLDLDRYVLFVCEYRRWVPHDVRTSVLASVRESFGKSVAQRDLALLAFNTFQGMSSSGSFTKAQFAERFGREMWLIWSSWSEALRDD